MLQVGGMQLFRVEAFDDRQGAAARGPDRRRHQHRLRLPDRPGAAGRALVARHDRGFEAVAHAMTSIATGGFSTSDDSIGHFNSAAIDWSICLLHGAGQPALRALPQRLARQLSPVFSSRDSQVRLLFLVILVVARSC